MKTKRIPLTPELLQTQAVRAAPRIGAFGWRPNSNDLAELRASTQDAVAYRICARAWRRAGFRIGAIRKLAGRAP